MERRERSTGKFNLQKELKSPIKLKKKPLTKFNSTLAHLLSVVPNDTSRNESITRTDFPHLLLSTCVRRKKNNCSILQCFFVRVHLHCAVPLKWRNILQMVLSIFSLLMPTGPFYIYTINYFNLKNIQFPTIQNNSQSTTVVKKRSDQWANLHRNLRAGKVPSTGDRVGGVPTLPAFHTALTKYFTRDTPSLPEDPPYPHPREGRQRPK